MSPSQGPIAGGTIVSVKGVNFAGAAITLDRNVIAPLSQSDAEIRLQMPKHDNGYAIVSLTKATGTAYGRFLYLPPRLDEISPGYITTVAGIGQYGGEYGPATSASIRAPWGLAFDRAGLLYLTDTSNNRVLRIRSDGILEPFAGNGFNIGPNPQRPMPAIDVSINFPRSIAFDHSGNLIVPSTSVPPYIWRVDPSGLAEIIAGNGQLQSSVVDGVPARETAIGNPTYVAVDSQDNIFFIDWDHARIRKIDPGGIISTVAGNGTFGFSGDGGPATNAQFNLEFLDEGGLAVDHDGNPLLLDYVNRRIRRIDRTTGVIDTVVGPTISGHSLDAMRSITVDAAGALLFANAAEIYRRTSDGTITQIHSGNKTGFSDDGTLFSEANIGLVAGMIVDSEGNLIYIDGTRVRRVDHSTNRIATLAGIGPRNLGEGDAAVAAILTTGNLDLDFLGSGELLIADVDRMDKIDHNSRMVRIAGSGISGPLEGVPALQASMAPASASVSRDGTIDYAGGNIFRIDPDGIVRRTAAFGYMCGFSGDGGDALKSDICEPWDVLRDNNGNVLVADTNNNRIRRIDRVNGTITTIAGSGPANGLERYGAGSTCGDGGPATSACINTPYGLTFDDSGNLFICENRERIRKIDRNGIISTFVAPIPCTKLVWAFGSLFTVAHDYIARVSRPNEVTALTARGFPQVFGGDGGPASEAHIMGGLQSHGVAVDSEGNLFFTDENLRVRAIRYGAVLAPPNATIQATVVGSTIRATVFDGVHRPAPGVRVDLTAPKSGPSCHFPNNTNTIGAITDSNGVAATSCVANCGGNGSFIVTAQPLTGSATATVTMSDVAGPCRRRAVLH